jgi:hypothetical protein
MKQSREKLKTLEGNLEEMQKCKASPCYFYNNYIRKDGEPEKTEEEFNQWKYQMELVRNGKMIAKPRNYDAYIKNYPLTEKDVLKK